MAGIIQENFCRSRMTVFCNFKHHIKLTERSLGQTTVIWFLLYFIQHEQNRGSQPSTPVSLSKPDSDSIGQARRGSRGKIQDDEEIPLTHKTGTVGIVALAIRNKNGQKKETEFKVKSKSHLK